MKHITRAIRSWLRGILPDRDRPDAAAAVEERDDSGERFCDVVIGFDFGTSCTKIVLRTPYERDRAFAVSFERAAHPSSPYLLPSGVWVGPDETVSLTQTAGAVYLQDIKYQLMCSKPIRAVGGCPGDPPFSQHAVAVAFLALALRHARTWFREHHKGMYGGFTLDWQVNLGLPSADFADERLCREYLRVAAAAWHLSLRDDTDLRLAISAYQSVRVCTDGAPNGMGGFVDCGEERSADIRLIPEVAAEVAGYARSHMRDEGLHILVDIGASTLDVCGFILHEREGDDCYELLTADVRELGAMVLHRERITSIAGSIADEARNTLENWSPVEPIPEAIDSYVAPPDPKSTRRLGMIDDCYRKRCSQMLWGTLVALKTTRDPNSRRWNDEMPLFLCGGASGMRFYREWINSESDKLKRTYSSCLGLNRLSLTKPDKLEADITGDTYHRLAVAWGLSYPETDIGDVTRPNDIPDIEKPPERDRSHLTIGKEVT